MCLLYFRIYALYISSDVQKLNYWISHGTLPNWVSHFISGGNFKLSLLHQFLMDFLENGFLDSYISCLCSCDKGLCKIYMLQFHFWQCERGF